MKTIEYPKNPLIDRTDWPAGEWDNEPDKIQWQDETTGYPCLIVRNRMGGLCGYVGVPRGHQFYEVSYDNVQLFDCDGESRYPPVHGGLTFSDKCSEGPEDQTICHLVEEGEDDDVWWVGFDCVHSMDIAPQMLAFDSKFGDALDRRGSYKNIAYVRRNVEELAIWLKKNSLAQS